MDLERFMAWEAAGGMENSDFRTETESGKAYLVWEAAVAAERERCAGLAYNTFHEMTEWADERAQKYALLLHEAILDGSEPATVFGPGQSGIISGAVAAERAQIRSALIARGDAFMVQAKEAEARGRQVFGASRREIAQALYNAAAFLCAP